MPAEQAPALPVDLGVSSHHDAVVVDLTLSGLRVGHLALTIEEASDLSLRLVDVVVSIRRRQYGGG
jgi:hypothetical protein